MGLSPSHHFHFLMKLKCYFGLSARRMISEIDRTVLVVFRLTCHVTVTSWLRCDWTFYSRTCLVLVAISVFGALVQPFSHSTHAIVLAASRQSSAKDITYCCEQPAVRHVRRNTPSCRRSGLRVTHRKWLGFVWVGVRPAWLNWARVRASERVLEALCTPEGARCCPNLPTAGLPAADGVQSPKFTLRAFSSAFNAEIICSTPVFHQERVQNV